MLNIVKNSFISIRYEYIAQSDWIALSLFFVH